jgi:hypothetical protein
VAAHVRTVKAASGATAVQIVHSSRRGAQDIEHLGSAHDDAELEVLKAAARYRLTAGQAELDLGLDFAAAMPAGGRGGQLPITASRMGHLVDALIHAYRVLGFEQAVSGDEVFGQLVLVRIIEPTSKLGSLRVLGEAGVPAVSYATGQAPPAGVREGFVAAAPRRGVRRARLEALVPPGSRPARRVLTDRDRVPGAGRVLHGIAPPS